MYKASWSSCSCVLRGHRKYLNGRHQSNSRWVMLLQVLLDNHGTPPPPCVPLHWHQSWAVNRYLSHGVHIRHPSGFTGLCYNKTKPLTTLIHSTGLVSQSFASCAFRMLRLRLRRWWQLHPCIFSRIWIRTLSWSHDNEKAFTRFWGSHI